MPSDQPADSVLSVLEEGGAVIDVFAGACLMDQILVAMQSHEERLAGLEQLDGAHARSRARWSAQTAAFVGPRRPVGRPRGAKNKPKPSNGVDSHAAE